LSWVSPTGFEDPVGKWSDEPNAYDEDTASKASNPFPFAGWDDELILTHAALQRRRMGFSI